MLTRIISREQIVLLPGSLCGRATNQGLDYEVTELVEAGSRVIVPFRKREVEGFIVGVRTEAPKDVEVLPVATIIDRSPLIRPDIFELCRWISGYYIAPLGEVLKSSLPPGISAKHVESGLGTGDFGFRISDFGLREPAPPTPGSPNPKSEIRNPKSPAFVPGLTLTEHQLGAFDAIRSCNGFHTLLLHGVTGSGKSEIYMRAAEHFLAAGKTSLILVPEIGLTPQLTDRFTQRFPGLTAVLHSSLSKRQRIDEWLRIYCGKAPIVIGTRSAVFAPLQNLGLIVVDEEHERAGLDPASGRVRSWYSVRRLPPWSPSATQNPKSTNTLASRAGWKIVRCLRSKS